MESFQKSCFATLCFLLLAVGRVCWETLFSNATERPCSSDRCFIENGSWLCSVLCLLGIFNRAQPSILLPLPTPRILMLLIQFCISNVLLLKFPLAPRLHWVVFLIFYLPWAQCLFCILETHTWCSRHSDYIFGCLNNWSQILSLPVRVCVSNLLPRLYG